MIDKNKPIDIKTAYDILQKEYGEILHNSSLYPILDRGEKFGEERYDFDDKESLTFLMLIDVVSFINNHAWEDEWPVEARRTISLLVNTNDCFVYACSDAEEVLHKDIESLLLWNLWSKEYGWLIWASIKQNQKPLVEWIEQMEADGIKFNEMASEWGLEENHCNKIVPRW